MTMSELIAILQRQPSTTTYVINYFGNPDIGTISISRHELLLDEEGFYVGEIFVLDPINIHDEETV